MFSVTVALDFRAQTVHFYSGLFEIPTKMTPTDRPFWTKKYFTKISDVSFTQEVEERSKDVPVRGPRELGCVDFTGRGKFKINIYKNQNYSIRSIR